jgi:hypothetical protein
MKRSIAIEGNSDPFYLPRDIWILVVGEIGKSIIVEKFLRLCPVSSWWRNMVYEPVASFRWPLSKRLTDQALKRFVALEPVRFPFL